MRNILISLLAVVVAVTACRPAKQAQMPHYQQLYQDFVDMRYGMFICYNIMSYGAKWGEADYPIDSFNPQKIDCNQWADAAVSSGMKFGLLTTKHHEGFCLWDSKFTDYDVASTPYKKDIVQQYVDAFRKKNLKIGLYYSIWDSSHGVDKDSITSEKLDFIKGQITELLTNYGKVDYFVIDGWFWRMGHRDVSYIEIRDLIRELQPDCLVTDHTHLQAIYHLDIPYFEGPFGAFPEAGNTMPSALGHCSVKGNGWFWSPDTPHGLKKGESADSLVAKLTTLENRYCTFMLNCMPNRDGLLDTLYIDLLSEIGTKWKLNPERAPLPLQDKPIIYEVACDTATATSGNAYNAVDAAKIGGANYTDWESSDLLPQTLTLDLGATYSGIELLQIVPKHHCKPAPETKLTEGNITHCKIYSSEDGQNFTLLSEQQWKADGNMKTVEFASSVLRFIRIEILECNGKNAVITETAVGAFSKKPVKIN